MLRFGINIEESAIIEVVKVWSGQNSRNSLNYNEFNKNFKGFGN